MNTYVYDSLALDKKTANALAKTENRLTDLGLSGRTCRASILKKTKDIVLEELKKNPSTLIAVGDDQHVSEVVSYLTNTPVVFGIIPIGETNQLAKSLGINLENSAQIISARRIVKFNLGLVDHRSFLKSCLVIPRDLRIQIDSQYFLDIPNNVTIKIFNYIDDIDKPKLTELVSPYSQTLLLHISQPQEKKFLKKTKGVEETVIVFKELKIVSGEAKVFLDELVEVVNPQIIKINPASLNIIVGKDRLF